MMVGVPVLFCACECACWPFVCVVGVVVGVSGWWVFQWWVAVVWASRRVPGVPECLGVVGVVGWVVSCVSVVLVWLWVSGVCVGVSVG